MYTDTMHRLYVQHAHLHVHYLIDDSNCSTYATYAYACLFAALGALSMESLKIEARALQKQLQVVARTLDREYSNLSSSSVLNMPGRDIAEPQKKKVWAKHIFTIGTGPVGRIEVQLNASDGAYIGAKSIEK